MDVHVDIDVDVDVDVDGRDLLWPIPTLARA